MRTVGLLVGLTGAALAVRSAALLAGRGRPQRGARPAFVIAGPYTRLRNPLLLGLLLALAGLAMWRDSALLGATAGIAAAVAHWWVVRIEEPRLRDRFGGAYDAYLRNVPRWMPRHRRAPG